jgi:glycosyltransferase involved in cell wall biosynthesis
MPRPLVTVICLCYNHERFVKEALNSVLNQSYDNIQIIIVDDASMDSSASVIQSVVNDNPQIQFLSLARNAGNCKAFNYALKLAKGEFIIDFATDDVMMPEKIQRQVDFFLSLSNDYGVVFTDALYIDAEGKYLRNHFDYLFAKGLINHIPEGNVYRDVLTVYFIASPTMMIRREVLESLQGYDEELSYEDFDFWVRSSRVYKYACLKEQLVKIRRKTKSMSSAWYVAGDPQLHSTYKVCKKAMTLNRTKEDRLAWTKRVKYELRQSVFSENHIEAQLFYSLLIEEKADDGLDKILIIINRLHLPLASLRQWYHQLRFQPLR